MSADVIEAVCEARWPFTRGPTFESHSRIQHHVCRFAPRQPRGSVRRFRRDVDRQCASTLVLSRRQIHDAGGNLAASVRGRGRGQHRAREGLHGLARVPQEHRGRRGHARRPLRQRFRRHRRARGCGRNHRQHLRLRRGRQERERGRHPRRGRDEGGAGAGWKEEEDHRHRVPGAEVRGRSRGRDARG